MNDTLLGAIIGAAAAILGAAVVQTTDVLRRRARRRTFALVLAEEVRLIGDVLKDLLSVFPHDGLAKTTDAFMLGLSRQDAAGHLFLGLLPNLDVLPPDIIRSLSRAYTEIRMNAGLAQSVLARGGGFNVPSGQTKPIWDELQELTHHLDQLFDRLVETGRS